MTTAILRPSFPLTETSTAGKHRKADSERVPEQMSAEAIAKRAAYKPRHEKGIKHNVAKVARQAGKLATRAAVATKEYGKIAGEKLLAGSMKLDVAVGRSVEETAKFLGRHRTGAAHTVGVVGAIAGAALVSRGVVELDAYGQMQDMALAAMDQETSGKTASPNAGSQIALGTVLFMSGLFSHVTGMAFSADRRERSARRAPIDNDGFFAVFQEEEDLETAEDFDAADAELAQMANQGARELEPVGAGAS